MTSEPEGRRSTGRHAAPRLTVRGRMQLPVGRALALTAVPTALLMGSIAPRFAFAADAKAVPVSSSTHDQAAQGADCGKPPATTAPVTKTPPAKGPTPTSTDTPAPTSTPSAEAGHTTTGKAPGAPAGPSRTAPAPTSTSTPSPSATQTHKTHPEPIKTILNGLGGILGLTAHADPTTAPPATVAPKAAATAAPTTAPTATAPPTATAKPTQAPTATPTPTATGTTAAPSASTTPKAADPSVSAKAEANRLCDISKMAAPLDATVTPGEMPADPWTLKTSRLALGNTQFWGVKTVKTTAGDVRVLKFTAQTIGIDNLDMSVKQNGQRLHIQGGSGTTSTMAGGTVTMYVTSLSGTLAKAEGIPLAELGIKLTLTPDTLPEWLYDLVGSVPIPLNLELDDATAIQTGQFGGNLTIPGMHLYYTPLS